MVKYKTLLCVLALTTLPGLAVAQNNTNSPYTRYGYGQLSDQSSMSSKGMGGVGYALRNHGEINTLNPASHSAVDSLTFIFEGGITLQNTNFSDGVSKLNAKNSSFDYVAMKFRLHRRIGMSLGFLPFSNVGYSLSQTRSGSDTEPANTVAYSGEGGLHQIYLGAGFNILRNLAVGVNASYIWGDIDRQTNVTFPGNSSTNYSYVGQESMSVSDFKFDFGLQYSQRFGRKNVVTLGAVFSPKMDLNNDSQILRLLQYYPSGSSQATVVSYSEENINAKTGIPYSIGGGLSYVYDNRLTVAVDYNLQKWGQVSYMGEPNTFTDRSKVALGIEYLPNATTGRNYFSFVKYRLGGYYSEPYYKVGGEKAAREYGVSGGFTLPLPRTRSLLHISAQYVNVTGLNQSVLNEKYLKLSIGVTFNERWFFKRKVD